MSRKAISITPEQILKATKETDTAHAASVILGVTYTSFIRYAKKYNLYEPNQGGRGRLKPQPTRQKSLEDILKKGVKYNTTRLKERLLASGLKQEVCEVCNHPAEWNGKRLILQLDHIDGDNTNNEISNLQIICPNCHSQTPTFCRGQFKNGRLSLLR